MRRSIATLLLPLAALSACATAGGGEAPGTLRPGFESGGVSSRNHALRVRLADINGDLRVELNRRAHVAVFQVVPGEGVALVSPFSAREKLHSGFSTVVTRFENTRFYRYDDALRRQFTSYGPLGTQSGMFGMGSHMTGPRHLLVVASDRPLRISRFTSSRGMLRRAIGTMSYTSLSSRRVMDDLLATVLEPQPESSWDADVLTVWPANDAVRLPRGNLYRLRCRDGSVVWVPLELADAACRDPERVAPPLIRPDSLRGDTAAVRKPGGRRPQPEPAAGPETPRIRMSDFGGENGIRGLGLRPVPETRERPAPLSELREDLAYRRFRRVEGGGTGTRMMPGAPRIEHMPGIERLRPHEGGGSTGTAQQAPRLELPTPAAGGSAGGSGGVRPEGREKPTPPERSGGN
jgi:hypothetical protein